MKRSAKAALMAVPFLLVGSGTRSNEGLFVVYAQQPPPIPVITRAVYPTGALQKCLAGMITKNPQAKQFCDQLPAAAIYNQAGERFQARDHAGAAQIVRKAAEAGNAIAQMRLAIMIDQNDGVPQDFRQSHYWYARAAEQGEPESMYQVAGWYEIGDGVPENWDLSAELRKASAEQGWMKGQYAYGRAYQFGIGVPQNRQLAIAWYQKAAAQGHPDGAHWAQWLSNPTNNIGFRSDVEHDFVMGARLRFGASLLGGDPAGITFHNSGQRALWIKGYNNRITKDERDVMRDMHQREYEACKAAGGDCTFLRF